ncbi:positive regulation of dendritic spine morphogenesis [Branchiostoma belcheri]|nr:positive regulation of dendritic spine morphogenesis [Branchiostoma belcheri]
MAKDAHALFRAPHRECHVRGTLPLTQIKAAVRHPVRATALSELYTSVVDMEFLRARFAVIVVLAVVGSLVLGLTRASAVPKCRMVCDDGANSDGRLTYDSKMDMNERGEARRLGVDPYPYPPQPTPPTHRIAFSVARTTPIGPLPNDTILPFDFMFSNAGGAFDMETGIFTAPVSGTYFFSFRGQKRSAQYLMYLGLWRNGEEMAGVYEDNLDPLNPTPSPGNASNNLVLHLFERDQVYLMISDNAIAFSTVFGKYVGFTGFLLFPDNPYV